MSSHARVNAEESHAKPRRTRRIAWRFWLVLAIVLCGFWELKAVIFGLNGMAHVLAQGLGIRNAVLSVGQVAVSEVRSVIGSLGHWLVQLSH